LKTKIPEFTIREREIFLGFQAQADDGRRSIELREREKYNLHPISNSH